MKIVNPLYHPCPWEVGDILTTENATPPAQRWPGTQWEQIQERFLLGAGVNYVLGSEGGEALHTLTVEEMPSHNHGAPFGSYLMTDAGSATELEGVNGGVSFSNIGRSGLTGNSGASQPHNNMPPYRAVYIWRRTA